MGENATDNSPFLGHLLKANPHTNEDGALLFAGRLVLLEGKLM